MEDSPWVVQWTHLLALSIILGRGLALRRRDGGFTMGCAVETPLGIGTFFYIISIITTFLHYIINIMSET